MDSCSGTRAKGDKARFTLAREKAKQRQKLAEFDC